MEILTYNKETKERTIAQFKAMALKKAGNKVTRLVDTQDNLVAFGYNADKDKQVPTVISNVKFGDYDFIYWN